MTETIEGAVAEAKAEVSEAQEAIAKLEALMRDGMPAQPGTPETDADPQNPNVGVIVTRDADFPPEPDPRAFEYGHMGPHEAGIIGPFCELANNVRARYPAGRHRALCLNALLDAAAHALDAAKVA